MPRRTPPQPITEKTRPDARAARTAAVALLARRDYASGELRAKLHAQAFDEVTLEGLIADLAGEGILNDERYAHNYVAYHAQRGQGPVRIGEDLRKYGLSDGLVAAALAGGPDWRALALKVRTARFGTAPPSSRGELARQVRFLQYRGFSSDDVRAATGADFD
jgi:regulatory protein